uniref:Uncharacterized protein n=1 Tax=Rhinella marina erythrocytic-like virus TaxID=2859906 RepID=A0A8F6UAD2_9VIRU|nr:hypothetical protein RMELV053 [Rhinella marina erythrocytic-like virus]
MSNNTGTNSTEVASNIVTILPYLIALPCVFVLILIVFLIYMYIRYKNKKRSYTINKSDTPPLNTSTL